MDYTEILGRFIDLREAELRKRLTDKYGDEVEISEERLTNETREALAAEIPQITKVLKEEILLNSVIEWSQGYSEINELFGEGVKDIPKVPFMKKMNNFFGLY